MTTLDESTEIGEQVDAAFHYGGLVARAVGYLLVYAFADRYDCGPALLTGVLLGDLLGQVIKIAWSRRQSLLIQFGDLVTVGIVFLLVRSVMVWPDDPALRAVMGLSAFSLFVAHAGSTVLTRLSLEPI